MTWRYLKFSFGFWFGLGWTVAGIIVLCIAAYTWSRYEHTKDDYYEVRGTIVDKGHRGKSRNPYIVVGYVARDGQPHKARPNVSREAFDQYHPGGEELLYVAGDDPDDAWLEADGPRTSTVPWVVTAVGLVFLIPGSLIFLSGTTTALKRKHVLEVGQPFTGKVIGVEPSNFRVNNVTYSQYRFVWKGVDGLEHEATSLPFPPNQVKYDEGDPITVYSDPTDPDSGEVDLTGFRGTAPR